MKRLIVVLVLGLLLTSLPALAADVSQKPTYVLITALDADGGTPFYVAGPVIHCTIYGTWDGASVDVEYEIEEVFEWRQTTWTSFIGATSDVAATTLDAGAGRYRVNVSSAGGSTSLTFYCRWSPHHG